MVLPLSAANQAALIDLASSYRDHLEANPDLDLRDLCYTTAIGRQQLPERLALVASTPTEMGHQLEAFLKGETEDVPGVFSRSRTRPKTAFLFTGQGFQYFGMGQELYETVPIFRTTLNRCDQILRQGGYLDVSLVDLLYSAVGDLDQTAVTQPVLFAVEYALAQVWLDWGIKPDIVLGHSVGEYPRLVWLGSSV